MLQQSITALRAEQTTLQQAITAARADRDTAQREAAAAQQAREHAAVYKRNSAWPHVRNHLKEAEARVGLEKEGPFRGGGEGGKGKVRTESSEWVTGAWRGEGRTEDGWPASDHTGTPVRPPMLTLPARPHAALSCWCRRTALTGRPNRHSARTPSVRSSCA